MQMDSPTYDSVPEEDPSVDMDREVDDEGFFIDSYPHDGEEEEEEDFY